VAGSQPGTTGPRTTGPGTTGPRTTEPRSWATPADVLSLLRRRWESGIFLVMFGSGQAWEPLAVPVRGPTATELAARFADAQAWAQEWEQARRSLPRVEFKKVGGRAIGSNTIPCRVWVDSYDQLWSLLGVQASVRRLAELTEATRQACPRLAPWLAAHPMTVLRLQACWAQIIDTVRWIGDCQPADMYLREIDVPGVDTKFIENHRGVLADLLDLQLGASRINPDAPPDAPPADFARRYGFRRKPEYVRFRLPAAAQGLTGDGDRAGRGEFTELSVRANELTAVPSGIGTAYVIENEITYLAFPLAPGAMVIFGAGYAVSALESLGWLSDISLWYWGDIDTHGFAILNRLRGRFPHARSMLMDRPTLLAYRSQWVTEPSPTRVPLDRLDPDEAVLYRDLAADVLGPAVRLEQERIRFSAIGQRRANADPGSRD
jgi:hypothetical protein